MKRLNLAALMHGQVDSKTERVPDTEFSKFLEGLRPRVHSSPEEILVALSLALVAVGVSAIVEALLSSH